MMEFFKENIDYDIKLEKSILGIFLLEPNSFGSVYGIVTKDCFYNPDFSMVFEKVEKYWKSGGQIDLLTISREFYEDGILTIKNATVGYYLAGITMDVVSSAHLSSWCIMLRSLYAKRIMASITHGGIKGDDVFETAQKIQSEIQKAVTIKSTQDWVYGANLEKMMFEKLNEQQSDYGISTSIDKIDEANGGFKPGQMVIVAARPSVGKSLMMGRMATYAAMKGKKVGVISLEMVVTDVFTRMVSAETNIPFKIISNNLLHDQAQQNVVYSSISTLSRLPIFFSETSQVNMFDIRAKAEQLQRKHGLDMLLIDYLQLIESTGGSKNSNRENEVSKISRGIKILAMDLKIPVIVLAQLNRNVEGRKGKDRYPVLSDLRESGGLEQDADVVIFMHSDYKSGIETNEDGSSTEHERDIIVAKWRNAEADLKITMGFDGPTMKLTERTPYLTTSSNPNSPAIRNHYETERNDTPF